MHQTKIWFRSQKYFYWHCVRLSLKPAFNFALWMGFSLLKLSILLSLLFNNLCFSALWYCNDYAERCCLWILWMGQTDVESFYLSVVSSMWWPSARRRQHSTDQSGGWHMMRAGITRNHDTMTWTTRMLESGWVAPCYLLYCSPLITHSTTLPS